MALAADSTNGHNKRRGSHGIAPRIGGKAILGTGPKPMPSYLHHSRQPTWQSILIVDQAPRPSWVRLLGTRVTVLEKAPAVKLRVDWPAPHQVQAIVASIRCVESAGLRVLRVDNDDWMTLADLAHRVGRSRETTRLWAAGRLGPGKFPPPANPHRDTSFFSWVEVVPWLRDRMGMDLPEEEPALVAANIAIQLRAMLPRLSHPQAILDLLR